jgi:hypothetical protein
VSIGIILLAIVIAVVVLIVGFKILKAVARLILTLVVVATVGLAAFVYKEPLLELWRQLTGG